MPTFDQRLRAFAARHYAGFLSIWIIAFTGLLGWWSWCRAVPLAIVLMPLWGPPAAFVAWPIFGVAVVVALAAPIALLLFLRSLIIDGGRR